MKKIELPGSFTNPSTDTPGRPEFSHLDDLAIKLGLKNALSSVALRHALENIILFDRKQSDYGPGNIADFGIVGVVIRANDKMNRLKNLIGKKRRRPNNESIEDTFRDLSNYGIIGMMVEKGEWPNV